VPLRLMRVFPADVRWLPSARTVRGIRRRLIRQPRTGDWPEVAGRVARALADPEA
jgi:hypothetical protein